LLIFSVHVNLNAYQSEASFAKAKYPLVQTLINFA